MGIKGGDLTRTDRIEELVAYLNSGSGVTVEWYEEHFNMSSKTMKRDLAHIQENGVQLEQQVLDDGTKRYVLPLNARKIQVPHTIDEITALFLGRGMFDFLEGTALKKSFDKVYDGIARLIKKRDDLENAAKLETKFYMVHEGPKQYSEEMADTLDVLIWGLRKEMSLEVEYHSFSGNVHEIEIQPYTLVSYKRGLYVVARVPAWENELRSFALERFAHIEKTYNKFRYDKKYHPREMFRDSLFMARGEPKKVVLDFPGASGKVLNIRKYHPTQELTQRRNGDLRMTLMVPLTYELENWVMSFGPSVTVVQPKKLKERVVALLEEALANYGG